MPFDRLLLGIDDILYPFVRLLAPPLLQLQCSGAISLAGMLTRLPRRDDPIMFGVTSVTPARSCSFGLGTRQIFADAVFESLQLSFDLHQTARVIVKVGTSIHITYHRADADSQVSH